MKLQPRKQKPFLKRTIQLVSRILPFGAAILTVVGCKSENGAGKGNKWDNFMRLRGKIAAPMIDSTEHTDSLHSCDSIYQDSVNRHRTHDTLMKLGGVEMIPESLFEN